MKFLKLLLYIGCALLAFWVLGFVLKIGAVVLNIALVIGLVLVIIGLVAEFLGSDGKNKTDSMF